MQTSSMGILIELTVSNHPGVMSHICGLFTRRAYNLEKILCFPKADRVESKMWLLVHEKDKLEQVIKQVEKLEDVRQVTWRKDRDDFFHQLEIFAEQFDQGQGFSPSSVVYNRSTGMNS